MPRFCILTDAKIPRLWTEVATVFTPGRETDCFLSIGTGMPPNTHTAELKFPWFKPWAWFSFKDTVMNFVMSLVSAATNSESNNVLFGILLKEYAPRTQEPKYFRLNYAKVDPVKSTKELEDYEELAALDVHTMSAMKIMEEKTRAWIETHSSLISEAATALGRNLDKGP